MSQKLQTAFCGIPLENPCILASAPPTQKKEGIAKALQLGWAGAVTKTCTCDNLITADVSNRFAVSRAGNGEITGFENIEGLTHYSVAYWEKAIQELKRDFSSKAIIASVMADERRENWRDLAQRMEAAGADAIELNLSCPHFRIENAMGAAVGKSEDRSSEITSWVKASVKIPVIVKLTPNVSNIQNIAVSVIQAGADALSAINTVQALMGVDLDTFEPLPAVDGYSAFGGYSGPAVKPIGLRCVAQLAQVTNVPIHGIGGISRWQDIVEYMAVGACCVQICSAVMLSGYRVITPLLQGLEEYVANKSLHTLREVIGAALSKITSREQLNMAWNVRSMVLAPDKCQNCGKCVVVCSESGKQAIQFINKKVIIDRKRCDGCSLCTHVCPNHVLKLSSL